MCVAQNTIALQHPCDESRKEKRYKFSKIVVQNIQNCDFKYTICFRSFYFQAHFFAKLFLVLILNKPQLKRKHKLFFCFSKIIRLLKYAEDCHDLIAILQAAEIVFNRHKLDLSDVKNFELFDVNEIIRMASKLADLVVSDKEFEKKIQTEKIEVTKEITEIKNLMRDWEQPIIIEKEVNYIVFAFQFFLFVIHVCIFVWSHR